MIKVLFLFLLAGLCRADIDQHHSLERIVEWMRLHHGRMPLPRDFGNKPGQIAGGPFPRDVEFWQALKVCARTQGLKVYLLDVRLENEDSEEWLKLLREEALSLGLAWRKHQGRWPRRRDFQNHGGTFPVDFNRLIINVKCRVFASLSAYEEALESRWPQTEPEQKTADMTLAKANELILQWMRLHPGQMPSVRDYGPGPGQIPLNRRRLFGTSDYASGKCKAHLAFCQTRQSFWFQFREYALHHGFPFRLLTARLRGVLQPEVRIVLQQEALSVWADWLKATHNLPPVLSDFNLPRQKLPFKAERLFGQGSRSIFDSFAAFDTALRGRHSCLHLMAP